MSLFESVKKCVTALTIVMISMSKRGVLASRPKSQKTLKCMDVCAVFGFCGGLVVYLLFVIKFIREYLVKSGSGSGECISF